MEGRRAGIYLFPGLVFELSWVQLEGQEGSLCSGGCTIWPRAGLNSAVQQRQGGVGGGSVCKYREWTSARFSSCLCDGAVCRPFD